MNIIRNLLTNLRSLLDCACELFRYGRVFLWAIFCPRAVLAARLLAAESQLAACKHQIASKKHPQPRFTVGFRLLWVLLSKSLDKWEDLVHLMQAATVKKWHICPVNGYPKGSRTHLCFSSTIRHVRIQYANICTSREDLARNQLHGCHFCVITWMCHGQSISSQLRPSVLPHCMFSLFLTMVVGRLYTLR